MECRRSPSTWLSGLALSAGFAAPAQAQTKIRMVLNWKYQGPQGMFFLAQDRGYFKQAGLDVTMDQGNGSGAPSRWSPTAPMTSVSATSMR